MQDRGRETREHILRESRRLFTVQGFYHTSVSDIINATGVKKGNLYYHFPSKEELGLAVLRDARDEFFAILERSLTGSDPRERIIRSCRLIMDKVQETNFVGGCLFGNAALEMSDADTQFSMVIREVFSRWIDRLVQELQEARKQGVVFSLPLETLAMTIVSVLEGGIMLARVYKSSSSLDGAVMAVASLLNAEEEWADQKESRS